MQNIWKHIKNSSFCGTFIYVGILIIPLGTRIQYLADSGYIGSTFVYEFGTFLYLSDLLLVLGSLYYIYEYWRDFRNKLPILILIILALLISLFHVKQLNHYNIYHFIKYVELLLIFMSIAGLAGKKSGSYSFGIILYIGGVFESLVAFLQFHMQHGTGLNWLGEYLAPLGTPGLATIDVNGEKILRAYGTFPHPNILGAFLVVALAIGYLLVARATNKYQRLVIGIANFIILIGIFLTFSRTAWLAAVLISIGYLLKYFKNKHLFGNVIISGLVSCVTILFFWRGLIVPRTQNIIESAAYIDRGLYNHFALEVIKNDPLFGAGVGNYISKLVTMFHVQPWQYQPPHNIFLFIAAELGLPVAMIFIYCLYVLMKKLIHSENSDLKFFYMLVFGTILLMSLFDHYFVTIQQGQLLFAVLLGLMLGFTNSHAQTQKSN